MQEVCPIANTILSRAVVTALLFKWKLFWVEISWEITWDWQGRHEVGQNFALWCHRTSETPQGDDGENRGDDMKDDREDHRVLGNCSITRQTRHHREMMGDDASCHNIVSPWSLTCTLIPQVSSTMPSPCAVSEYLRRRLTYHLALTVHTGEMFF